MQAGISQTRQRRLIALVAMTVLAHIAFTGGRVALSLYAIKLHASPLTVGLLVSLLSVIPMLLSVHLGRWTDRVGIYKPAVLALTGEVVGAVLPALHESLAALCVSSVVLGTSFMVMHIAVNNATGHESTAATRTQAFTRLAIGFSLSSMLGPVIAGFTIDHLGHAATFAVLAAFPLVPLLVLLWTRKQQPVHVRSLPPPEGSHVMDLLRNAPLRAVFIVSGLLNMAWDMFTFMVPVQGTHIGLSASSIGLIMGSFGVATLIVRLAMPLLTRRVSEWQTLTFALAVTAIVYSLFPLFTGLSVLMLLAFALGLGMGMAQPTVLSLIHRTAPPGRTGEAIGVRTTFLNSSQVFMPIVFGALSAATGMVPAFWTLALILSAGSFYSRRRNVKISS
jgi:predicted MFS family arabinose efflux permease